VPAWSTVTQVDFVRWSPGGSAVAAVATWPVSGIHTSRALVVDTAGRRGIVALGAADLWGGDWSPDG
jgi:hypothetical protein